MAGLLGIQKGKRELFVISKHSTSILTKLFMVSSGYIIAYNISRRGWKDDGDASKCNCLDCLLRAGEREK